MKIELQDLEQALNGELGRAWLVHGDENLLLLEAADAIRAAARSRGFDERAVFSVEGRFNWQEPLMALQGGSLFSSRTLLEIRLNNGKLSAEVANGLLSLVQALHTDSLLLLTAPRLDKSAQQAAWRQALQELSARELAIATVERRQLPQWIAARLARQGQTADSASLAFIADRVEGNLLAAHQEVLKLGLLCPAGRLAAEQVRAAVLNVARYDVYQLSEAMLTADVARYIRILDGLQQEGEAAPVLIWILADDLRAVGALQKAAQQGGNTTVVAREWRLWGERQRWVEQATRRLRPRAVWNALTLVAAADRAVKGVSSLEPWQCLRQIPLVLQGGALPPGAGHG